MNPTKKMFNLAVCSVMICALAMSVGCSFREHFIKNHVKGAFISDSLQDGTTVAKVDNGTFTDQGWMPGAEGQLIYDLPSMPQGKITFDAIGLERMGEKATFVTMYEPSELGEYADPYILLNPYRVTLTIKPYEEFPHSTFDFLWTLKQFQSVDDPRERYVEGLPENVTGYEQMKSSGNVTIFPDETYSIAILWEHGKARLYVNDKQLIEHDYTPNIFNPDSLRVVIGHSPGEGKLDLPDLVISNVEISFPKM